MCSIGQLLLFLTSSQVDSGEKGLGFRLALKGHADIGSDEEECKQGN